MARAAGLQAQQTGPDAGWEVSIVPATKQVYTRYYGGMGVDSFYDKTERRSEDKTYVVAATGEMAVRLTFDGKDQITVGTAKLLDEGFDDDIAALRAKAEEKAATLTAVGARGA